MDLKSWFNIGSIKKWSCSIDVSHNYLLGFIMLIMFNNYTHFCAATDDALHFPSFVQTGLQLCEHVNKCVPTDKHYALVVGDDGLSQSKKILHATLKCDMRVKSRGGKKPNREQTSSKFVYEDDHNVCTFRTCTRFNRRATSISS